MRSRDGRAVQHKVSDAEAAMADGQVEAGRRLLIEAAELLVHDDHAAQGVMLLQTHGLAVEAAQMVDRLGDTRKAAQLYAEAQDWLNAAEASERVGDRMTAAEMYERAGRDVDAGRLYETLGDHVRAARVFERAGAQERAAHLYARGLTQPGPHPLTGPEATEVCRRAGVLYATIGDLDAAVQVLRMGRQLLLAGQLMARGGRHKEAIDLLVEARDYLGAAQVAREMGNDRQADLLMAERAHNDGRLGEAAEHLERAGEYGPAGRFFELVGQHARAAAAYRAGGHHEAAAILFERLGQVEDAALALRAAGRDAEAEALANRAAPHDDSIRQNAADGHFFQAAQAALTLARRGDPQRYAEVIAYLEEVRPSDPQYFECRTMLAEVLEETGDAKRALSVLQPMFVGARPEPKHVPAMYQYGRLLEMEGFLAGARNAYQTVAAFDPSYRDLQARLRTLRESDVATPMTPAHSISGPAVPTLPVIVGGPEMPQSTSEAMALFDRELQAISGEPLAPVPDSLFDGPSTGPRAALPSTGPDAAVHGIDPRAAGLNAGESSTGYGPREDALGHGPREDALGHGPREDALGHGPHEDGLGHGPREDGLGHEDALGHGPHEDALGHGPHEDALGHGPHEDALGGAAPTGGDAGMGPALLSTVPGAPSTGPGANAVPLNTGPGAPLVSTGPGAPSTPSAGGGAIIAPELIYDLEDEDIEPKAPQEGTPLRPEALVGLVLRGRFRIERKLGRGAQAQVYLARDQVLDRAVAIKVLNQDVAEDEKSLERFLREARLAARVHHAGCLAIFDFGQERGLTFMAMEYFKGRTLRDVLKKGPLEAYVALRIARDVAAALSAVHEAGIVHRDIKPTNVMVDKTGSVRIADFGVARTLDDGDGSGMMVGTMRYMAPEQARGKETDRRADIFSLGVVMFEMLAGKAPYGGTLDDLIARVTRPPPELPDTVEIADEVRSVVRKCMARKPEQRYEAIGPLLDDLNRILLTLREHRRKAQQQATGHTLRNANAG